MTPRIISAILPAIVLGVGILFDASPARAAEQLPNATEIVRNVGRDVYFEDVVKAVSYSRSRTGYYLSFGAPYPKQVLSVWASEKVYDHLPGSHFLVGRKVRIKGKLVSSPTGPMLDLDSREQYELLPVEEVALTKQVLDGKMDRDQFKVAEAQIFWREDFNTLETLADELRQSRERFSDGTWLLDAFFHALRLGDGASKEKYAEAEQKIARWESSHPGSLVATVVKAGFHVDLAWKWRGNGLAKTVTPEGWENFKRELGVARGILESNPAAKVHPEYFALMQAVALGQGWRKEDYFRLFSEATSMEPEYYRFYFEAAFFLSPRWYGKRGEWEQFAEQQREQHGAGGAGDALYARIAWSMKDYYKDLFHETAISWEVMGSGFEYLIKQYPNSGYLKNVYANFAWRADDRARLRRALPEIRDNPDMTVWVNLENVQTAENFVNNLPPVRRHGSPASTPQ
jgi:hypothetical protein